MHYYRRRAVCFPVRVHTGVFIPRTSVYQGFRKITASPCFAVLSYFTSRVQRTNGHLLYTYEHFLYVLASGRQICVQGRHLVAARVDCSAASGKALIYATKRAQTSLLFRDQQHSSRRIVLEHQSTRPNKENKKSTTRKSQPTWLPPSRLSHCGEACRW